MSTGVRYNEASESAELPLPPKPKQHPVAVKPNRFGPSQSRIDSRNKSSATPAVRLPAIKTEPSDVPEDDTLPKNKNLEDNNQTASKTDAMPKKQRRMFKTKKTCVS